MAASHGRLTKVTVATKDVSPFCKTSNLEKGADVHDITGYGATDKAKGGGLIDSKFTCGGTYDNTASTGPRNVFLAAVGTTVAVVRQLEGAGTGKPQDSFNAVVTKYTESNPVDDYVSWTAELEITGPITSTAQV